jgi:hypothetical protein
MRGRRIIAIAAVAGVASAAAAGGEVVVLPPDEPVEINGLKLVCTGVGDDAKKDPRWRSYAVRMEFANARAEYVSDVEVSVAKGGAVLLAVRCDSPWVLADLEAGKYEVTATFDGQSKTQKFSAPKTGQTRLVVRFPR